MRSAKEWEELIRRRPIRRMEDSGRLDKRLAGLAAALYREDVPPNIAALKLAAARRAGLRRVAGPVEQSSQKIGGRSFAFSRATVVERKWQRLDALPPVSEAYAQIDAELRYLAAIHQRVWFDYGPLSAYFVLPPHPDLPRLIRQLGPLKAYQRWLNPQRIEERALVEYAPPRRRVKIPKEMQRAIDRRIKQRAKFAKYDV